MSDRKRLEVFVSPQISFGIPEDISREELETEDYTIQEPVPPGEGYRSTAELLIVAYRDDDKWVTVETALSEEKERLVKWFGEKGYDVTFQE